MFNIGSLAEIIIRIPVLLIALSAHEFSHGLAAYLLGDSTAKTDGRLTLNPLRHVDPVGIVCLLLFRFGWAKPVMVNPYNFKNPKQDMAIISFAGPLANLLLAFISVLIYYPLMAKLHLGINITKYIIMFFSECIFLNLSLAVFNLIPVPPLDGSKLFAFILPDRLYFSFLNAANRFGYLLLIILVWSGLTVKIVSPVIQILINGMLMLAGKIYFFL